MKKDKISLGIVDDHQIVIDGLKALLKDHPKFSITLESNNPVYFIETLKKNRVDIVITDIMMPEMNGQELAKLIRKLYPDLKIMAMSMSGEGNLVNQMIEDADISAYVLKNIGKDELIKALDKVAAGGIYFSEQLMKEMFRASEQKKEIEEIHLTEREIEIIGLIEKEMSNKEIADKLFISERTVETHRKNIFRKTKTNSVIGLIKFAYEHKLI
jgi:DNA-binding NarL/FixJ family response regulator